MLNLLNRIRLKWIAYGIELFLIFIIQSTPNLLPPFLGVRPMLLAVVAISIAVFEGDRAGLWVGLAAGLLTDLGAGTVFGFNALVLMIICYLCGTLVVFLMRNNILTAMLLGFCGLLLMGLLRWFFFYFLWEDQKAWYYIYAVMLPQLIYSIAMMPLAFYFNRAIASRLRDEE